MNKIINLKNIETATELGIPDFDGERTIYVRVRRPNLMSMVSKGQIENPLLQTAYLAINGYNDTKTEENAKKEAKRSIDIMNLYCSVCLVEPTFEEFDEYMTDDQRLAITSWAISSAEALRSFRKKEKNNRDNKSK